MKASKLEYLWEGTKVLLKLKKMNFSDSYNLKELPDLSYCPNIEELNLSRCNSLEQLPSSMGNLHKLEVLETYFCLNLEYVPLFKLASLEMVNMLGCWKLRKFPDISKEIISLGIGDIMLEEVPDSLMHWSGLTILQIWGSIVPCPGSEENTYFPDLGGAKRDIEKFPDWIKGLQGLKELFIIGCPKLASLSEFPVSLTLLIVDTCDSLATVSIPSGCRIESLYFFNCLNLSREAQREITYHSPHSSLVCFPGKTMPEDFDYRAIGNSLTIQSDCRVFRVCVVLSTIMKFTENFPTILCRVHINGCLSELCMVHEITILQTEHLFIYPLSLLYEEGWREQDNQIVFEFSTTSQDYDIVGCGVKILTGKTYRSIGEVGYESWSSYGSTSSEEVYESGSFYINISSEGGYESGSSYKSISSEGGFESESSYRSISSEGGCESGSEQVFDGCNEYDEPRVKG